MHRRFRPSQEAERVTAQPAFLTTMADGTRLAFVALLLAALLPLPLLTQSLWLDEASSVWFARLPLANLLFHLCDPHPPGYYLVLKGWLALGETEPWLRLPSLLASVLAVAFTARAGRQILGGRGGDWAALLLAAFPLQSWYAAEARMYALVQALGIALLLPAWRLLSPLGDDNAGAKRSLTGAQIGFWLLATAALAIDVSALLPYAALQLWWLARGRPHAGHWLRLQAAVLIPILAWWLTERVGADTYHAVFVAVQARRLGVPLDPTSAGRLLQALMALAGLTAAAFAWRFSSAHSRVRRLAGRPPGAYLVLTAWLLLLVFSAVPRLFTVKRLLVVILPYLALALVSGLRRWRPRVAWGAVALGLAATAWMLVSFQREPWREAVASVAEAASDRGAVAWVDELAVPAFDYYSRHTTGQQQHITWTPLVGADLPALPGATPAPDGTLWLVLSESPYRNLRVLLSEAFQQQYQLVDGRHYPGIGLYRYRRLAEPLAAPPALTDPAQEAWWGLQLPSPLATCR